MEIAVKAKVQNYVAEDLKTLDISDFNSLVLVISVGLSKSPLQTLIVSLFISVCYLDQPMNKQYLITLRSLIPIRSKTCQVSTSLAVERRTYSWLMKLSDKRAG
jgi:hypothetical protein